MKYPGKIRLLTVLLFLLVSCVEVDDPVTPRSSTASTSLPASPEPALPAETPESTLMAIPAPSPSPPPRPSPTASAAPLPLMKLSVPASWQERAAVAVEQLNRSATEREWRLAADPQADIRLTNSGAGVPIREVPLVLAVPFTTPWESVSLDEAEKIMSGGHEMVSIVPWAQLPPGHKSLKIEGLGPADADYPLRETWSLVADDSLADAVADLAPLLQQANLAGVVHLAAVGDLMLDRSLGYNLELGDLGYPFAGVAAQLREADITAGNLESALGDTGEPEQKRYPFRAPPGAAEALRLAGFDIVSLANNHGMDYGEEALLQAIDLLRAQDVSTVGAGANKVEAYAPQIVEVNGLQVAFLGYVDVPPEASTGFDTASWTATEETAGIAWADPEQIAADIGAIRDQVDLVVVLLHSGFEYQPMPSKPQKAATYAAVEAGADLVVGHHAHILQGIEWYRNGVIIYGTGNFAFDIDGPPETAIFHVWLDQHGVREIDIEPAIVQFGGQPRLATSWEAPPILNQIYYLTDLLNAR